MIPAIGLLLSIYLMFKGVEIYQIYRCSNRDDNAGSKLGVFSLVACLIIGGLFALLFLFSGSGAPGRLP